uniref:Uncharacterized protein n=1 Tax=Leersia perrieri TaxID=77586 RepID=A0A0D9VVM3_9ORYZ
MTGEGVGTRTTHHHCGEGKENRCGGKASPPPSSPRAGGATHRGCRLVEPTRPASSAPNLGWRESVRGKGMLRRGCQRPSGRRLLSFTTAAVIVSLKVSLAGRALGHHRHRAPSRHRRTHLDRFIS